jgi:hypothetical protein
MFAASELRAHSDFLSGRCAISQVAFISSAATPHPTTLSWYEAGQPRANASSARPREVSRPILSPEPELLCTLIDNHGAKSIKTFPN